MALDQDDIVAEDTGGNSLPTRAVLIVATEGELTADARMVDPGGLSWRTPPLPLTVNHDPNQRVGRLDEFARVDDAEGLTVENWETFPRSESGRVIVALATLNHDTELGLEVAGEIRDGFLTGISMEVGDEVIEFDNDDVMHLVEGRIGAVSVVVFQAIESARIVETASAHQWSTPTELFRQEAVVAAAAPVEPPAAWFENPGLDGPTAIVVTDEGQVFGHLALWGTCHTGRPADVCLTPPRSEAGYAYFRTGYVTTVEGAQVPVGTITMATGHAPTTPGVSAAAAVAHYEHTGAAVADVAAGEDTHGIWFAGALRPGVTAEQVRELRGASLSGDWRSIKGGLELVAALAVNVPGFPVPRVQAGLAASGVQTALVAAGYVDDDCGCDPGAGDTDLAARVAKLEGLVRVLDLSAQAVERLTARLG
jgi:hypothetical protein